MFMVMLQYNKWILQNIEHTIYDSNFSDSFSREFLNLVEGNIAIKILEGKY